MLLGSYEVCLETLVPVRSHTCDLFLFCNFYFLFSAVFHWQATIMGPVSRYFMTQLLPLSGLWQHGAEIWHWSSVPECLKCICNKG